MRKNSGQYVLTDFSSSAAPHASCLPQWCENSWVFVSLLPPWVSSHLRHLWCHCDILCQILGLEKSQELPQSLLQSVCVDTEAVLGRAAWLWSDPVTQS